MTIQTAFAVLQHVIITPLERMRGRITEISFITSVQYKVCYFHNGESRSAWCYEDELEAA